MLSGEIALKINHYYYYYLQRTGISLSELQPDTKVHDVICAYVSAHDTAWDQTAILNAIGEYVVNAAIDANSPYLMNPEPKRKDPATGAFSSPGVTIVHAAFRDRYDW